MLFSDTVKGADATAICYSIIESAKLNDLNDASIDSASEIWNALPVEHFDALMPWSCSQSDYCK